MRPLHLAIDGLACFRDPTELDLRGLELFAISGPTGAGKSTLLDAVCLALYGVVPRVGRGDLREMISSGRDRLSVRLEFAIGDRRFRVTRVHKRRGAGLARLEELRGAEVELLADQVRAVTERVVELVGLEVDAFTQAVLLPQGEFAKFLKAAPAERRSMLRRILRLQIYERMRERAQAKFAAERVQIESIERLLATEYAGLDAGSIARLAAELERRRRALAELRQGRDLAHAERDRARSVAEATARLRAAEAELAELSARGPTRDAERRRLDLAAKAEPLLGLLAELERRAAARDEAVGRREAAARELTAADVARVAAAEALAAALGRSAERDRLRDRLVGLRVAITQAAELPALERECLRADETLRRLEADRTAAAADLERATVELAGLDADLAERRGAAEADEFDAELDRRLDELREAALGLGRRREAHELEARELTRRRQERDALARSLAEADGQLEARRGALARARAAEQDRSIELEALRRRDLALHLRSTLAAGEACPVCLQAVETPPCPEPPRDLEAAERSLATAAADLEAAERGLAAAERARSEAELHHRAAAAEVAEREARLARLAGELRADDEGLRRELGPRAPSPEVLVEEWLEARGAALRAGRARAEAHRAALAELTLAKERAVARRSAAQALGAERAGAIALVSAQRAAASARLSALRAAVSAVAGAAEPEVARREAEAALAALEAALETAQAEARAAETRRAERRAGLELRHEEAGRAADELREVEGRLADALTSAGFDTLDAARAAQLPPAERGRRETALRAEDARALAADARVRELGAQLGPVRVDAAELARLEAAAAAAAERVEAAAGEVERTASELERARERAARAESLAAELATRRSYADVEGQLATDLRSDRFQAFLLEETFTSLARGAAVRLLGLTSGRYSLEFVDDELRVIDHDNAGESRLSDTLSGGETFLASLALALELSDQVQRAAGAVRLDSLFIDEGFGTLDPETLSLVADTIQSLPVGGRMVGIITHIPELRDEFEEQVVVHKRASSSSVEVRRR